MTNLAASKPIRGSCEAWPPHKPLSVVHSRRLLLARLLARATPAEGGHVPLGDPGPLRRGRRLGSSGPHEAALEELPQPPADLPCWLVRGPVGAGLGLAP